LVERDDESTSFRVPIVSVNRAAWYHLAYIDFDYPGISAYYSSLPYPDKPHLEDCRIHVSPLACVVKRRRLDSPADQAALHQPVNDSLPPEVQRLQRWVSRKSILIDGLHLSEPTDAALFDPLAPPTDILILLGWSVILSDPSRLASALGRELASYARDKEARPTISDGEKRARDELKRLELAVGEKSGGLMSAVEGAVEGVSVDTPLNILISMGVGAAETVAEHAVISRSQRRALHKIRNRLLGYALKREAIIRSESLPARLNTHTVKVQLRKDDGLQDPFIRAPYGRRWPSSIIDYSIDRASVTRSLHQLPLIKS
jgi:hypothetical protein